MHTLPLTASHGHLFARSGGARWLVDTGSPSSFGATSLHVGDDAIDVPASLMGLDAPELSRLVGTACDGLIGTDILGRFDCLFDVPGGQLTLDDGAVERDGTIVPLDDVMGVPIVDVTVAGRSARFFFDTGAQVSYWQSPDLAQHPSTGMLEDFYPGIGAFETETYDVPMALAGISLTERCGRLPGLLEMTLSLAGAEGILSNRLFLDRVIGFFPRRGALVI